MLKNILRLPARMRKRLKLSKIIQSFDTITDSHHLNNESLLSDGWHCTTIDALLEEPGITKRMQNSELRKKPIVGSQIYYSWDIPDFVWEAILNSETIFNIAKNYIGANVRLDDLYIKTIVDGLESGAEGWHDDNVGYRLKIFMVFDTEGIPSDTLLIPHSRPNLYTVKVKEELQRMIGRPDIKNRKDEIRIKYKPGDCLIFDTNLLHRGDYTTSAGTRYCLVAEFIDRRKADAIKDSCPCGPGQSAKKIVIPTLRKTAVEQHQLIDKNILQIVQNQFLYGYEKLKIQAKNNPQLTLCQGGQTTPSTCKKNIKFVYCKNKLHWGSTTMRAHQMARIISPHLPHQFTAQVSAMPSASIPFSQYLWTKLHKPGDILIFTKYAAKKVLPQTLEILKKNKCYTCRDYVDSDLRDMAEGEFDFHLAASYSAYNALKKIKADENTKKNSISGKIMLLLHNADERLINLKLASDLRTTTIAYLGSEATTFLPKEVRNQITYLEASSDKYMESSIPSLPQFNVHYCIRSEQKRHDSVICKPFTKGFNAALLGAQIITQKSTDDAIHFLGEDYPYFVEGIKESEILEKIGHVRSSYQSKEWYIALDRIMDLRNKISPQSIANQILEIAKEVESS